MRARAARLQVVALRRENYVRPEHSGCGQWQFSDIVFAESSQYCEQYFFPSVQTQLQF